MNPLPHIPSEPSRERAKSHGSMRRQRRQTCCAGRASSHLIAGNWSSSRKKGKAQSWGQPAPSLHHRRPNVRRSFGRLSPRRPVAILGAGGFCMGVPKSLHAVSSLETGGGFGLRLFSGFKFFRAVERGSAPVRQQAAHQIFQDFAERLHRQLSNLPVSVADQHSDGARAWDSKSQSTRCQK